MKQLSKISAILLLVGGLATTLMAQPAGNGPQKRTDQNAQVEKPYMMLPDLTDAQKDQMKDIHLKTMKQVQPLRNQLMEKRAHLKTLTTADKADIKAINGQIDDISKLEVSIEKIQAASHQEVRSLLTDEQRVVFDSHRGGMMGNRSGFGPKQGRGHGQGAGLGNPNNCPFNN
ncbi:MAG: Spy/CpxP family protein refolding chaperone [Cyclobacteriaceae bacterium]|nr:Spy/CpxP family protein refolding chaperone [Cyclobacteriaceae bacterium]